MKIAIYDSEHFETTYTLVKAFSLAQHHLTLFVTAEVAVSLRELLTKEEASLIDWVLLERAKIKNTAILYRYCRKEKVDVLWFGTISHHYLLFGVLARMLRKAKTILTIHDANSFFKPAPFHSLRGSLNYTGKKLLAASINGYSTLLTTTKQYIENNFSPSGQVSCIPGSFFTGITKPFPNDINSLVMVVPGSVDTKRRNYTSLFALAEQWQSQNRKLEVILLGGARDAAARSILQQLDKLSTPALKFTIYSQAHISQEEYDRQLTRCDFVFAPLQEKFAEDSALPEQYGLTKSSGCFFDAVRFGKPLLLPAEICLPDELAPQTIVHATHSELVHFITHLTSEKFSRIQTAAINNAKRFTVDIIATQINTYLASLR